MLLSTITAVNYFVTYGCGLELSSGWLLSPSHNLLSPFLFAQNPAPICGGYCILEPVQPNPCFVSAPLAHLVSNIWACPLFCSHGFRTLLSQAPLTNQLPLSPSLQQLSLPASCEPVAAVVRAVQLVACCRVAAPLCLSAPSRPCFSDTPLLC